MRALLLAAISLATAACATGPQYVQTAASNDPAQRQLGVCQAQAKQLYTPDSHGLLMWSAQSSYVDSCMRAAGYEPAK